MRHIPPRLPANRLGGPLRCASKPLDARGQGSQGLAVELDCETRSKQADRDDDSEPTLGADDDAFVAPERAIGDRDRGAGFDIWVRDERKAAFLKGPETPQLLSLIHISEPTRLGMISYAVFCLKKKKK